MSDKSVLDDNAIMLATSAPNQNAIMSTFKEEAILLFYYGPTSVAPSEFIDSQLDHILLGQLNCDELSESDLKKHVLQFLSNYQHWACTARLHNEKILRAVRFPYFKLYKQYLHFFFFIVARIQSNKFKIGLQPTSN